MSYEVRLRRGQLDRFRRLARESPLEIQAYLEGRVVSPELTVVDRFVYTDEYGIQTEDQAAWFRRDYEAALFLAEKRGRCIVGSIHSHPHWDAVVSPSDYEACIAEGHRLCGIVSTDHNSTRVRFWVMDCALPADIIYESKHESKETAQIDAEPASARRAHQSQPKGVSRNRCLGAGLRSSE